MWNEKLAACVDPYPTGVLTTVDVSGYPLSVRCAARLDHASHTVSFPDLPAIAATWRGKACLLFHRHNDRLEGLHQLVLKGELVERDGALVLQGVDFVTANGRVDSDELPHAGTPVHMLRFFLLGRRKAREYLKKRGEPWPPIPYDDIERQLNEGVSGR